MSRPEEKYQDYLKTWAGKRLLKNHSLDEYGIWKVNGEDPNPDMGGPHVQPTLGYFSGKLEHVIRLAVLLNQFWAWGGGGKITPYEPPNIRTVDENTWKEHLRTKDEVRELERKLAEAKRKL